MTLKNTKKTKLQSVLDLRPNSDGRIEGGARTKGGFKKSEQDKPLVTVITAVFNGAPFIRRAIDGVLKQTYSNVEHVIIDAGSTDGTIEILREYDDSISYWISESDNGISDAFNKGISLASGVYHIILGADDWYEPFAIAKLVDLLTPEILIACGSARLVKPDGLVSGYFFPQPSKLNWKMSVPHNTCLVHNKIWKELGGYNVEKCIAMDHDFMLKALRRYGLKAFSSTKGVLSNYQLGGVSDKRIIGGFRELRTNIIENTGSPLRGYLAYLLLVIKSSLARISILSYANMFLKTLRIKQS